MAEASKPKAEPKVDASSSVKVKNVSGRNICLTSGILAPDKEGEATIAEASTLSDYIKKV